MVNLNNYEEILNSQKKYKAQLGNVSTKHRIEALQNLKDTIKKYEYK